MLWEELETIVESEEQAGQQQVVSALLSLGCCARCVLRFLGEKQQFIYRKDLKALQTGLEEFVRRGKAESGEDAVDDASISSAVCVTCLGILQDKYCSDQFINQVHSIVAAGDYQYATYFCSVLLPVSIIVREHSVWLQLQDINSSVYCPANREMLTHVKEVWKWYNGADLGRKIGAPFDQRSPFEVTLNFVHPNMEAECSFLCDVFPRTFVKRKTSKHGWETYTRANVTAALRDLSDAKFKRLSTYPPRVLDSPALCDPISCCHEAVFVAGRYNKYSRDLSQTPWLVEGVRKTASSVEELVCDPIKEALRADEFRFSSAGREDLDVKMLGTGRPFVVEMINPHRSDLSQTELSQIQQTLNEKTKDIAVRDLQIVTREQTNVLKVGEIDKVKHYSALCWCENPVTDSMLEKIQESQSLTLVQKTPIRVLHRRPLASRERQIHSMSARRIDQHNLLLTLSTQAGTYIKEFIHSDFGRTNPNLCDILGMTCDIRELNVEAVELDWPPSLTPSD